MRDLADTLWHVREQTRLLRLYLWPLQDHDDIMEIDALLSVVEDEAARKHRQLMEKWGGVQVVLAKPELLEPKKAKKP